jgi:hypothetical protein
MVESLIGASELVLGFGLSFGWARIGGRPFVIAAAVGIAACFGLVLYAATRRAVAACGRDGVRRRRQIRLRRPAGR